MSVIVIGAGVNELVCAHVLARAGRSVLVLAHGGETHGHHGWVPPCVVRDLGLEARGLKVDCPDPWASAPLPGGGRLELWRDVERSVEAIRSVSRRDASSWPAFCERMARLARLLESIYVEPPPDPAGRGFAGLARLGKLALRVRRLGRQGMEDLLRLVPISVADLLDDHFENDTLKGLLGAAGVRDLCQGPRSGGTALRLLHHHAGSPAGVFRPPRSNIADVLEALPGVDMRRGAAVSRILVREGRVAGVALAGGEELSAALVVSGVDPRRTLLELADPRWLDPALARAVRNIRSRGVAAHLVLALEQVPGFSTLVVAPSLDYLERAYDAAKHGGVSAAPWLEAHHRGRNANGRHEIEVHVQYAPYAPAAGAWNDERRRALADTVVKTLAAHAPELGSAALVRVLSPLDLEAQYGFPQGQAEHVEPGLDQLLWMRPTPQLAHYRTPIAGLYLCGPGTHPGGSVAGACGYNAARTILADIK